MNEEWDEGFRVDTVLISDLLVHGIIGVNPSERTTPQDFVINLEIDADTAAACQSDDIADCVDYAVVADKVTRHAATIQRFTVEALAEDIARIVLAEKRVLRVRVKVEKLGVVPSCRSVGITIERPRISSPPQS